MKTITLVAPSYWALAIANNDTSALDANEIVAINDFLRRQGVTHHDFVDCEDAGFRWRHDASVEMPLGADCQTYTFYLAE